MKGIGPFLEKRLNELGIFTFQQISNLSESDVKNISPEIGPFPDRVVKDRRTK